MAAQLASFVGKRILNETARNKFGQEVSSLPFNFVLPFVLISYRILILKLSPPRGSRKPLARRQPDVAKPFPQAYPIMMPKFSIESNVGPIDSTMLFSTFVGSALVGVV